VVGRAALRVQLAVQVAAAVRLGLVMRVVLEQQAKVLLVVLT
jgi:hypothetical protein